MWNHVGEKYILLVLSGELVSLCGMQYELLCSFLVDRETNEIPEIL